MIIYQIKDYFNSFGVYLMCETFFCLTARWFYDIMPLIFGRYMQVQFDGGTSASQAICVGLIPSPAPEYVRDGIAFRYRRFL